jgi:hypothetical protein
MNVTERHALLRSAQLAAELAAIAATAGPMLVELNELLEHLAGESAILCVPLALVKESAE